MATLAAGCSIALVRAGSNDGGRDASVSPADDAGSAGGWQPNLERRLDAQPAAGARRRVLPQHRQHKRAEERPGTREPVVPVGACRDRQPRRCERAARAELAERREPDGHSDAMRDRAGVRVDRGAKLEEERCERRQRIRSLCVCVCIYPAVRNVHASACAQARVHAYAREAGAGG